MPAGIDEQRAGQSPVSPTPADDSVPERSKETDDSVPEHSKPEDLEMQKPRMPTRPVCPSVTEREEREASGHAVYGAGVSTASPRRVKPILVGAMAKFAKHLSLDSVMDIWAEMK